VDAVCGTIERPRRGPLAAFEPADRRLGIPRQGEADGVGDARLRGGSHARVLEGAEEHDRPVGILRADGRDRPVEHQGRLAPRLQEHDEIAHGPLPRRGDQPGDDADLLAIQVLARLAQVVIGTMSGWSRAASSRAGRGANRRSA
jgi:hypothetical protein